ncbi:MAG TPA: hypothetical protein GX701_07765 [Clostridiales bacterium]|jgi:hypothetical protein|nr:hypothetical protein [Clostridiales bacterium]
MYKLSIPLIGDGSEKWRSQALHELKRAKADRVFLCPCRSVDSAESKEYGLDFIRRHRPFFEEHGYEVGVWISSLGHGGGGYEHKSFQRIVPANGHISNDSFCPFDHDYAEEFAQWVAAIAKTGAKMIMLDDDYRLGYRSGKIGCFCPLHLERVKEILGVDALTREELCEKALSGNPNPYRNAWMQANGESLLGLARRLRQAVDEVDPSIRLGHCAVLSTWDIDGVDSIALAKAFAGQTKPFLRLIGAPYWARRESFRFKLANVVEVSRMQLTWCSQHIGLDNIEVFHEGDVFPRPRHTVPSAFLEGFDTALRADGRASGILKYMLDYGCMPFYERGYVDHHEKNLPLYALIETHFAKKKPAGVRVFEPMHKLADSELPETFPGGEEIAADFFPFAARFLCDNSIPMQYDEPDVTILFGESARHATEETIAHGAILDGVAAKILHERGFDIGIAEIGDKIKATSEFFPEKDEEIAFRSGMYGISGATCYTFEPKADAEVVSELRGGTEKAVSFLYENGQKQRFLVYPFVAKYVCDISMLFRNYYRQEQLYKCLTWLRKRLPDVYIPGHPDLYVQTKKDESSLSVGLWNFFEDSVLTPTLSLGETWKKAEFLNCTGTLEGNRVVLSDIPAFSFAGVVLRK